MTIGQEQKLQQVLGNPEMLGEFVAENERFILDSACRATKRRVTRADDEWSIALEGFVKAVYRYEIGRGSFESFAGAVIHNMIMDYYRKTKHQRAAEQGGVLDENVPAPDEQQELLFEINCLETALRAYGLDLEDLVQSSPKAQKTRNACRMAASAALGREALVEEMRKTKQLPMTELSKAAGVSAKVLGRHRPYIIAILEIFANDLTYLSEYVWKNRR